MGEANYCKNAVLSMHPCSMIRPPLWSTFSQKNSVSPVIMMVHNILHDVMDDGGGGGGLAILYLIHDHLATMALFSLNTEGRKVLLVT